MRFVFNTSDAFNGFDHFGHFLRAQLQITNCVEYVLDPLTGCDAAFAGNRREQASSAGCAATRRPSAQADKRLPSGRRRRRNADGKVERHRAGIAGDGERRSDPPRAVTATAVDDRRTDRRPPRNSCRRRHVEARARSEHPSMPGAASREPDDGRRAHRPDRALAVFLAYNANNGLPFVPSYRICRPGAERRDARSRQRGPDRRVRVGVVESIEPVQHANGSLERQAQPEARQVPSRTLPVDSTVIVRSRSALGLKYLRDRPGHLRPRASRRRRHAAARRTPEAGRDRRGLQHLRRADPRRRSRAT